MLRAEDDIHLFGVSYRRIFKGLGAATIALAVLLVVYLPVARMGFSDRPGPPGLLDTATNHWTRLFVITVMLGLTAAAATLTIYAYYLTRERLAKVQNTAKAIMDSLVGGVLTLDLAGRITIINPAALRILELDRAETVDLEVITQKCPDVGALIRVALQGRAHAQECDATFVNSKGHQVHVSTTISEQLDSVGTAVGLVVLIKDVTKLIAMEQELRKRDRLAAAGSLAAGVAHEIRNPLSALDLNLKLLRDELSTPTASALEVDSYFEILAAEIKRLQKITSSFLQLSRPERLVRNILPINEPLKQVLQLLETEAREKGVSFTLDLAGQAAPVYADRNKLEQLFLNVIINALQAMPNGGRIGVQTAVVDQDGGNAVSIAITDEGLGIPRENIPRLFDPYFTTRPEGTGLGLAIAERIATDHGGNILVDSKPGRGTTMTIVLPLVETKELSVTG
jgi:PAS domain S-box-containing protein